MKPEQFVLSRWLVVAKGWLKVVAKKREEILKVAEMLLVDDGILFFSCFHGCRGSCRGPCSPATRMRRKKLMFPQRFAGYAQIGGIDLEK